MEVKNHTENALTALKKWGKQGKFKKMGNERVINTWQGFIELLTNDAEMNKQKIAGVLFRNLLNRISEDGVAMEFDGMRIKKIRVEVNGEYWMMKPIVLEDRLVLHHNKIGYVQASKIFGEEINLY